VGSKGLSKQPFSLSKILKVLLLDKIKLSKVSVTKSKMNFGELICESLNSTKSNTLYWDTVIAVFGVSIISIQL